MGLVFRNLVLLSILTLSWTTDGLSVGIDSGSDASDQGCVLTTNPDITGIGVRVSFYIQGFISIIAPIIPLGQEWFETAHRNALLTSLSLTIATFIQSHQNAVSVIDGMVIAFLPHVVAIGTMQVYICRPIKNASSLVFYYLASSLYFAFGTYFWATVKTFGSTPDCNINWTAQFVVFGKSISATSHGWRIFAITLFSISIFFGPISGLIHRIAAMQKKSRSSSEFDGPSSKSGTGTPWVILPMAAMWIYQVTTIEQILHRNGVSNVANTWTYGQILSMILTGNILVDIGSAVNQRKKGRPGEQEGDPGSDSGGSLAGESKA